MNLEKVKNALQDLIIRLQDAEKGYKEIINADISFMIKNKFEGYANERHQMHKEIEKHLEALGETPEVRTSFLGDIHRKFISFKLDYIDDNIPSIINEIERGSRALISDYTSVLELPMPSNIMGLLMLQKSKIEKELDEFLSMKEKFQSVRA